MRYDDVFKAWARAFLLSLLLQLFMVHVWNADIEDKLQKVTQISCPVSCKGFLTCFREEEALELSPGSHRGTCSRKESVCFQNPLALSFLL